MQFGSLCTAFGVTGRRHAHPVQPRHVIGVHPRATATRKIATSSSIARSRYRGASGPDQGLSAAY